MFKRGGVYWACFRREGKKKLQKSLGTSNAKLAARIEAKMKVEIAEGKYLDILPGERMSVRGLMDRFLVEHAPKVSVSQQTSYANSLKNLLPFFGDLTLSHVQPSNIAEYKSKRLATGIKPATLNRELACLSKAYNLAVRDWGLAKENPVARVTKEKEKNRRERWLTRDDETRLLAACPGWVREIVVFAIYTGFRMDEILSLKWPDVNLFNKTVTAVKTKNGEVRTFPLLDGDPALDVLKKKTAIRKLGADWVFPSQAGTKIDGNHLRRAFRRALAKTAIIDFRFHDLRHTFGSRSMQNGMDAYTLMKLMGHKNIATTMRYAHHSTETLRKSMERSKRDYNLTTAGVL